MPGYMPYPQLVQQISKWHQEAPYFTQVGTYGRSSNGTDLCYIRLTNLKSRSKKSVVLMTGSTHGNESLSTMTMMAYIGKLLDDYGKNPKATKILDTRDIYFIPVISPDVFPHSRRANGVDPNRDYPTRRKPNKRSIAIIQAVRDFTEKIQPDVAISGHTFGRVFLYPWGDSDANCPNQDDYLRILREMQDLSGYGPLKISQVYGHPIYGTEGDWYYRQGIFSIVAEYGNHQRIPTLVEIEIEFRKTYEAILYFIEVGPDIQVRNYYSQAA
jgi:predicted deacylase